jgi:diguanylate cyclase (GGDEF)-like protein
MARALVVDDDPLGRAIVARMCRRMSLEVTEAENGAVALHHLREKGAEVVLLDVLMPELDGFGVLEALKKEPVSPRPAVILVTAATDVHARLRGSELGALDFVAKPIRVEDLERRVLRALAVVDLERRLVEAQEAIKSLRATDGTTGAGSFSLLYGVLEAQFRAAELTGKPLSCALIGDEGFSRALAEGGRDNGDLRLHRIATTIESVLRPTDALFRVDAAEFVVLAPSTDATGARDLASRMRSLLVTEAGLSDGELAMAVATYPHADIKQASTLYRAANVALARARLDPRAGIVYYE